MKYIGYLSEYCCLQTRLNTRAKIETMKKVTKLGSKWNNSANAGTFYWNLNNATSNRNRNISRQLVNARNRRGNPKSPPVQIYSLYS